MRAAYQTSFEKDLEKLRGNQMVLDRIADAIRNVDAADNIQAIRNIKRVQSKKSCYRIRVGDYRIGVTIEADLVTYYRCLHRREIYRYFP